MSGGGKDDSGWLKRSKKQSDGNLRGGGAGSSQPPQKSATLVQSPPTPQPNDEETAPFSTFPGMWRNREQQAIPIPKPLDSTRKDISIIYNASGAKKTARFHHEGSDGKKCTFLF